MNEYELVHHLKCLEYKLKYKIPMVDTEYEFMNKVLKIIIEKMRENLK